MLDISLYAVGIDKYDADPDLECCAADAERFAAGLAVFDQVSVKQLVTARSTDTQGVTEQDMNDLLERISDANAGRADAIFFYFAGHGAVHEGRDYLVVSDSDSRPGGATSVRMIATDDIISALRTSGAGWGIVIIDACRADGRRGSAPQFGESTRQQAKRQGIVTIFGCTAGEFCRESKQLGAQGQGIFTHVLTELVCEKRELVPFFANRELVRRVGALCRQLGLPEQTPEIGVTSLTVANVDLLTGRPVEVGVQNKKMLLIAGPPHTGKSTIGARVARQLDYTHIEMSTYAYERFTDDTDAGTFEGIIQDYMTEVVWKDGAFDAIARDLIQSDDGVGPLVVCGPRRPEEVEALVAAGYEIALQYLYTDSRTRYHRYLRAADSHAAEYLVRLESFVRRDLKEYSWGLPQIGLMPGCAIVENQDDDNATQTVERVIARLPSHWHRP